MEDSSNLRFEKIVHEEVHLPLKELQESVDTLDRELRQSHGGRPLEVVEPFVRQKLKDLGITLSPGKLREYARSLSEGMSAGFLVEVEDSDKLMSYSD